MEEDIDHSTFSSVDEYKAQPLFPSLSSFKYNETVYSLCSKDLDLATKFDFQKLFFEHQLYPKADRLLSRPEVKERFALMNRKEYFPTEDLSKLLAEDFFLQKHQKEIRGSLISVFYIREQAYLSVYNKNEHAVVLYRLNLSSEEGPLTLKLVKLSSLPLKVNHRVFGIKSVAVESSAYVYLVFYNYFECQKFTITPEGPLFEQRFLHPFHNSHLSFFEVNPEGESICYVSRSEHGQKVTLATLDDRSITSFEPRSHVHGLGVSGPQNAIVFNHFSSLSVLPPLSNRQSKLAIPNSRNFYNAFFYPSLTMVTSVTFSEVMVSDLRFPATPVSIFDHACDVPPERHLFPTEQFILSSKDLSLEQRPVYLFSTRKEGRLLRMNAERKSKPFSNKFVGQYVKEIFESEVKIDIDHQLLYSGSLQAERNSISGAGAIRWHGIDLVLTLENNHKLIGQLYSGPSPFSVAGSEEENGNVTFTLGLT